MSVVGNPHFRKGGFLKFWKGGILDFIGIKGGFVKDGSRNKEGGFWWLIKYKLLSIMMYPYWGKKNISKHPYIVWIYKMLVVAILFNRHGKARANDFQDQ